MVLFTTSSLVHAKQPQTLNLLDPVHSQTADSRTENFKEWVRSQIPTQSIGGDDHDLWREKIITEEEWIILLEKYLDYLLSSGRIGKDDHDDWQNHIEDWDNIYHNDTSSPFGSNEIPWRRHNPWWRRHHHNKQNGTDEIVSDFIEGNDHDDWQRRVEEQTWNNSIIGGDDHDDWIKHQDEWTRDHPGNSTNYEELSVYI